MTSQDPEIIDLLDSDDDDVPLPSSNKRIPTRVLADGCVEILDSDDDDDAEENRKPAALNFIQGESNDNSHAKKQSSRTSPPKRQRTLSSSTNNHGSPANAAISTQDNDKEQDLQIVHSTLNNSIFQNPRFVPAVASTSNKDDDDEELEFLGSTGQNALSEFPHARENCVNHIFTQTSHEQHCTHCVREELYMDLCSIQLPIS